MPNIMFAGYYGMGNFGDDLFGYVAHRAQMKFWPRYTSEVLAPPLRGIPVPHGVPRVFRRAYARHDFIGATTRLGSGLSGRIRSDEFIYAGGSIFSGRRGVRSVIDRLPTKLTSAIGVSIGPFATGEHERRAAEQVKRLKYLAVRDRESARLAMEMDVPVVLSADLAGLLPELLQPTSCKKNSDPTVVFAPCSNVSDSELTSGGFCSEFISAVADANAIKQLTVAVLDLNYHPATSDAHQARGVLSALKKMGITARLATYQNLGFTKTVELIAGADVVVSGRLHGALVAYAYGVPFILHEYHRKCRDFLDDVGVPRDARVQERPLADVLDHVLTSGLRPSLSPHEYRDLAALAFTKGPWVVDE